MNAVNNPTFGKNISHKMLSVLVASDRSGRFFGDPAEGCQSKGKRLMSIGPLLFAPLLALFAKGGAVAKAATAAKGAVAVKSATLAKGAVAAKSATLAKGAAVTKAAATGLAT